MSTTQKINQAFEALIQEGKEVLAKCGYKEDYNLYEKIPSEISYFRFRTKGLNLIRRACGANSDHYLQMVQLTEDDKNRNSSVFFPRCFGVLEAAQRDFLNGLLFDMKALISAEVLGDFIEQAEALLNADHIVAAASLSGAVLEDSLRKLCSKHGLPLPESTKIDRLNADLARAGVYDKLVQKRITAIADIRNNADHGHFDKVNRSDVEDMVKYVRRFTADYLNRPYNPKSGDGIF